MPDFPPPGPWLVIVDRVRVAPENRARLAEALEQAFAEGAGRAVVHSGVGPQLTFSESFDCPRCGRVYEEPQPHRLSFNTPQGACPICHGFGNQIEVDRELVVPDPGLSLGEGAVAPWVRPQFRGLMADLRRFAGRRGIPWDVAWQQLSEEQRRLVLEGDDEFQGVIGFFRSLEGQKYKVQVRVFLSRYRGYRVCPACRGSRLRPEALDVKLARLDIHQVVGLSVVKATGQTMSYHAGDDGDLQLGAPRRYQDLGLTILDLQTGLEWEKKCWGCVGNHGPNGYDWNSGIWTWLAAVNAENGGAGFAGHNDWRIPNINELQTLADYGAFGPAIDAAFNYFPDNFTGQAGYWSSTSFTGDSSKAWTVNFLDGSVSVYVKSVGLYVRAVRGGQ